MRVELFTDIFPRIVIDDFFTSEEYTEVFNEINLLSKYFQDPEDTGAAKEIDSGRLLKDNKAIFLNDVYKDLKFSYIHTALNKIYCNEILDVITKSQEYYFNLLWKDTNRDNTLISYYEDSQYYEPHKDSSLFTALVWLWEEPKSFAGGDLNLFYCENTYKHPVQNNQCLIFPGRVFHGVDPVKMNIKDMNQGKGRYTLSKFIAINDV